MIEISVSVQDLVQQLQRALGVQVICGTLSLNLNESQLQSFETRTHQRILVGPADRRSKPRA